MSRTKIILFYWAIALLASAWLWPQQKRIEGQREDSGDVRDSSGFSHWGQYGQPGQQNLVYGHAEFQGNAALGASYLVNSLYSRPGDRPDSFTMAEDLRRISLAYAYQGYPHAKIHISQIRLKGDSLIRFFVVQEGPRIIVENLAFEGNRITKERVLRNLVDIKLPWVFNARILERGLRNLDKSGLFSLVGRPYLTRSVDVQGSSPILVFPVQERTYNSIFGALGYSQNEAQSKKMLVGSINLTLSNIAGTYRRGNLLWERMNRDKSRLEIGFFEPWVLGVPISGELGLAHRIEDSSYVQSRGEVMFLFHLGERMSAGFGIGMERVAPGTSRILAGSLKYRSLWRLAWDGRREDGSGVGPQASCDLDYGRKRYYQDQQNHTVAKFSCQAKNLFKIGTLFYPYLALQGRMVVTNERPVPRPEQFALGGAASLRGYFEEQFMADQIAWSNLELRMVADRRFTFYPFYDVGYYWDGGRGRRGVRHGYGLGLRLITRLGRVELDYGLGQDDGPWDGKVHLLLGSEF